ncbi:phytase [Ochrovirga pacifica]|uniref:phytase n=1 Tax=Ochrovirga pacifica TaxID=1042376 RepID=UPI0002558385|nr:phytase [Ochrovirga pacifica]
MIKKIILPILIVGILTSCQHQFQQPELVFSVKAALETTPVATKEDAADDICIWIHPNTLEQSTIIGTNKKQGLCVYNLQGELRYNYPVGKVNNVDIRYQVNINGKKMAVVAASNRTNNSITLHKVNLNGTLENIVHSPLKSELEEIYGLCMYQQNEQLFVFVSGKDGGVEKWTLSVVDNKLKGNLTQRIQVGSITEGMVADDETGAIYIAEENVALWKYNANDLNQKRTLIAKTNDTNLKDDFEGVTLYKKEKGQGYLILSSQGNNSYAVFDRASHKYLKSFTLVDGRVDGTNDTDGIDATSVSFSNFKKGFFIAQDGENKDDETVKNQNFKLVDFREILKHLP